MFICLAIEGRGDIVLGRVGVKGNRNLLKCNLVGCINKGVYVKTSKVDCGKEWLQNNGPHP